MGKETTDLLDRYRQIKDSLKCYDRPLKRSEFLEESGLTSTPIEKEFSTYTRFVEEAEHYYQQKLPASERALLSEQAKKFDPLATAEDCINDLRALKDEYPLKDIGRNFYRVNGRYSDSTWNRYFGTFEEFKKQAKLKLSRQQHKLEQQIAKHASVDHYKKYFDTEVAPFYKKFEKEHLPSKLKRMMVISDIHDIECDEFTLEVFIAECKRKQPDIIALNGDSFDLYEFSRYGQDPRHVKMVERFKFMHERVFAPLRAACPDAQIDFFIGNHEFRLIRHLADASPHLRVLLSDVMGITFAKVFGLDEYKINLVSKFDLAAFTKADIEEELKQNYKIYFDTYVVGHEPDKKLKEAYSGTNGHHHSARLESGFNLHLGVTYWVQTPACHVRGAEYLEKVSQWNTGFLEVTINTEKRQAVQRIHPTYKDWTEIDGVFYERKQ